MSRKVKLEEKELRDTIYNMVRMRMDEVCYAQAQKRAKLTEGSTINAVEEAIANEIAGCLETGIGRYEFDFNYDLGDNDTIDGTVEVALTEDEDGSVWAFDISPNLWINYGDFKTGEPYDCKMEVLKRELAERGIKTQD